MKYLIARYDVDADIEPIYRTRQEVARFESLGSAVHCANHMQTTTPGQIRGMFMVETTGIENGERYYRILHSAR